MLKKHPAPLRAKVFRLAGVSVMIVLVGSVSAGALKDRTFLFFSLLLFCFSIVKTYFFYLTVSRGEYETVRGVCVAASPTLFHRQRKVTIRDSEGNESLMFLPKQEKVKIDAEYAFYFKKTTGFGFLTQEVPPIVVDGFLGYERLP